MGKKKKRDRQGKEYKECYRQNRMRYYEQTKYPNIYKYTYWGNFSAKGDKPDKGTVENRNTFIEAHQIVAYKRLSPTQSNKYKTEADHQESYEDKLGRIVQVYSEHHSKKYPMYKPMKPIYALDQNSGFRKIETRKSKTLLMKQIFRNIPDDVAKYIKTYLKRGVILKLQSVSV